MADEDYGGQHYAAGFSVGETDNLLDVAEIITNNVWSPCVWSAGRRKKVYFLSSDFWSLDFDEGKSVADVKRWAIVNKVAHVIGLTKSHQREKQSGASVKPPCDRFRLVIPFQATIEDRNTFEFNMRRAVEKFRCDASCVDAARFYFPCVDIYSMAPGRTLAWQQIPEGFKTAAERAREDMERAARNAPKGTIPRWIQAALREGVGEGGRHKMCYRIGAQLHLYGFTADQIVGMVMASPLSNIGAEDAERAVRNGINRAREDQARFGEAAAEEEGS